MLCVSIKEAEALMFQVEDVDVKRMAAQAFGNAAVMETILQVYGEERKLSPRIRLD